MTATTPDLAATPPPRKGFFAPRWLVYTLGGLVILVIGFVVGRRVGRNHDRWAFRRRRALRRPPPCRRAGPRAPARDRRARAHRRRDRCPGPALQRREARGSRGCGECRARAGRPLRPRRDRRRGVPPPSLRAAYLASGAMTDAEPDEGFDSPFAHVPAPNAGPLPMRRRPRLRSGPCHTLGARRRDRELWFGPRPGVDKPRRNDRRVESRRERAPGFGRDRRSPGLFASVQTLRSRSLRASSRRR